MLFIAAGMWAAREHTEYKKYNADIAEANCTLLPNTLTEVGRGTCTQSSMNVDFSLANFDKEAWEKDTNLHDWYENVRCRVSSMKVQVTGRPVSILGPTWLHFRQQVDNCDVCAADRSAAQTKSVVRVPGCVDVNGVPIKSCSVFLSDYLRDQPHSPFGSFPCTYHGVSPPEWIAPGSKKVIEKNELAMVIISIIMNSTGAVCMLCGCFLAFCCTVCAKNEHDNYKLKKWEREMGQE